VSGNQRDRLDADGGPRERLGDDGVDQLDVLASADLGHDTAEAVVGLLRRDTLA